MSKPFVWQELFVQSKESTEYELLSNQHVTVTELDGEEVIKVAPEALTLLAQQAFYEASFFLRSGHLKQIASILHDPQASSNDKYVALQLLRNAEVSAKGVLPNCQTRVQRQWSPAKANRYGPAAMTPKRSAKGFTPPLKKITCAIRKTPHWICIPR